MKTKETSIIDASLALKDFTVNGKKIGRKTNKLKGGMCCANW